MPVKKPAVCGEAPEVGCLRRTMKGQNSFCTGEEFVIFITLPHDIVTRVAGQCEGAEEPNPGGIYIVLIPW